MFRKLRFLFSVFFLLFCSCFFQVQAQTGEKAAQTVVHLLSYISLDYSGAVQDGKIIDQFEYDEQIEFAGQVYDLIQKGGFLSDQESEIIEKTQELIASVEKKLPEFVIENLANEIKDKVILITGIQTAPISWPDLKNGNQLYTFLCADCHGQKGDGKGRLAGTAEPPPSNFLNAEIMSKFSAFQAYNSIKLGVQGTSMRPYSELTEEEIWDLAFYVKSLRFLEPQADSVEVKKAFDDAYNKVSLKETANLTDEALLDTLNSRTSDAELALLALRTLAPGSVNLGRSLEVARKELNEALLSYKGGKKTLARAQALNAYLEGIEPVETRLKTIDQKFVLALERQMLTVRQTIEKDLGTERVEAEVRNAMSMIDEADSMLKEQNLNFWLTFILAASIMLREGLEAFLILAIVLALIRSMGAKKALPWLHGGWVAAVILGFIGWFLSGHIVNISGRNREVMEGLISLFAVVVLMWAGFWLHGKTHAQQWTKFIKVKIGGYLQKDRMFGLALFSFMVVFREAFEVILFLQAISLEAGPGGQSAIGFGVLAAVGFIAVFAYVFLKYSKMIPVRQLFLFSSWIIVLLAVILLGKGLHSLQESGWLSVTNLPSYIHVDLLGIYPTLETVSAQIGLIAVVFVSYYIGRRKLEKAGQV